jgi:hypothetical protein
VFKNEFGGDISFETYHAPFEFFTAVTAERVIRPDARHSILVGDQEKTNYEMSELLGDVHKERESWWIYAIIIAAIALLVLFFHLYRSDFKWGSSGNQQTIGVDTSARQQ